jgi:hypothetical protein
MRRQTLKKPRSSTRHDHRSSKLNDAIQKPKKTLIHAAALLSLSLSMILTTQLQKGLSKAAPREPKRPSSIQCHEERERKRASDRASEASSLCERPRQAPFASDSSNISPLPPLPPPAKNRKLHRSDYQSSKSNRIVVHDRATPRRDVDSCFTNTIRLHTKNSLSIYN